MNLSAEPARPRQMLVLLAEDDSTSQRVFELMLRKFGAQVTIVDNGEQAVLAVQQRTYNVILMDIKMSVMDGLEAVDRILTYYGDRPRPYIIAVTAGGARGDCLAAGMDNYLLKPIGMSELEEMLAEALDTTSTHPQRDTV